MIFENLSSTDTSSTNDLTDSSTHLWADVYERKAPAGTSAASNERAEDRKTEEEKKSISAADLERRKEKVFADPDVKQFMSEYDKALKTGKVDENFTKAAHALGKKCLENYDTFYFMWHSMNANGVHLSVDKNGITFSRTEHLGGRDSLGHPAIPYGATTHTLSLPFDGGKPKSSSSTMIYGGPFNRESESIDKDKAAQLIFKPKEDPSPEKDPFRRLIK